LIKYLCISQSKEYTKKYIKDKYYLDFVVSDPTLINYFYSRKIKPIRCLNDLLNVDYNFRIGDINYADYYYDDFYESALECMKINKQKFYLNFMKYYFCCIINNFYNVCDHFFEFISKYFFDVPNVKQMHSFVLNNSDIMKEINKGNKFNYISTGELNTLRILDSLIDVGFKIVYFSEYVFDFFRFREHLRLDFFCILVLKHKIVPFVIEFDGEQHYNSNARHADVKCADSHVRDILKQYYLAQMGIHLLRVRQRDCSTRVIIQFVADIAKSDMYIQANPILPEAAFFKSKDDHEALIQFCNNMVLKYDDVTR